MVVIEVRHQYLLKMPLCVLVFYEQLSTNLGSIKGEYLTTCFIPFFIAQSIIKIQSTFWLQKCLKFNSNTHEVSIIWLDLKATAVYLTHNVPRAVISIMSKHIYSGFPVERALQMSKRDSSSDGTAVEARTLYVAKTGKKSASSTAAGSAQPPNATLVLLF